MAGSPYDQGRAARAPGEPDTDNPYRAGSRESLDRLQDDTADGPEPASAGPGDDT